MRQNESFQEIHIKLKKMYEWHRKPYKAMNWTKVCVTAGLEYCPLSRHDTQQVEVFNPAICKDSFKDRYII